VANATSRRWRAGTTPVRGRGQSLTSPQLEPATRLLVLEAYRAARLITLQCFP
jgi:hypothetical protein